MVHVDGMWWITLPPNACALIQPFDHDIIFLVKARCREWFLMCLVHLDVCATARYSLHRAPPKTVIDLDTMLVEVVWNPLASNDAILSKRHHTRGRYLEQCQISAHHTVLEANRHCAGGMESSTWSTGRHLGVRVSSIATTNWTSASKLVKQLNSREFAYDVHDGSDRRRWIQTKNNRKA